ncbi:MAG: hypothetical protein ACXVPQ_04285, partial [Bacteroidia bacterium]
SVQLYSIAQQPMVLSKVRTETEVNGILRSTTREVGEIELNPQSLDFTANFSILTAFINDSANSSPVYCVNLKAKFPVTNFDTWTEEYVDKNFTMSALVTINGYSRQYTIPFQLNRPNINRYSADISNLTYYPGSISFRLGINPDDFNMDPANAVSKKNIVIEIAEGIINRNQDALNVAHCRN